MAQPSRSTLIAQYDLNLSRIPWESFVTHFVPDAHLYMRVYAAYIHIAQPPTERFKDIMCEGYRRIKKKTVVQNYIYIFVYLAK